MPVELLHFVPCIARNLEQEVFFSSLLEKEKKKRLS